MNAELESLTQELFRLAKTFRDVKKVSTKTADTAPTIASIEQRVDAIEARINELREADASLPHPVLDDSVKLSTLRGLLAAKQADAARLKCVKPSPFAPPGVLAKTGANVDAEIERLTRLIRDEESRAWGG
jgi:chromosome segregation ATPase